MSEGKNRSKIEARSKSAPALGTGQPSLHTRVEQTGLRTRVEETDLLEETSKSEFESWNGRAARKNQLEAHLH